MKVNAKRDLSACLILSSLVLLSGCRGSNVATPIPSAGFALPAAARGKALPPLILVANFSGHRITGYPLTANGDQTPSLTIGGKKTGLGTPDNVALDSSDNIYTSIDGKTIGVFAASAHGDARRIRKIGGSNTGLSFPIGVAVDSTGYLYVADCGYGNVKVFAPGAHGNVAPIRVIGLTSGCTISEAVDSNDNLYVTSGDNIISEFSSEAQGNNLIKEIQEPEPKSGDSIRSIAVDSQSNIYAGNLLAKNIEVFAPSASGPAKPIRTIAGSHTHLGAPSGLAIDSRDNLYVTICHYCSHGSGTDSVLVFAAGAKGNAKPQSVLTGKKTKLYVPTDLVVRE
jgi:DNA-binding beta-propeller fold protein YncE